MQQQSVRPSQFTEALFRALLIALLRACPGRGLQHQDYESSLDPSSSLVRIRRRPAAGPEHSITGPRGLITVAYRGDEITELSGDAELIESVDIQELRTEIVAVFRAIAFKYHG